MKLAFSAFRRATITAAACLLVVLSGQQVFAQLGAGDIVVGLSLGTSAPASTTSTFKVYDASANTWSDGPAWTIPGDAAPTPFIQSMEFDNASGSSHNASGNLLGANFGNGNTGFELYNFATDGTTAAQSLWSIVTATGGTKGMPPAGGSLSIRGGGVSVSPDNTKVAWAAFDALSGESGPTIWVHDYSAGAAVGTGAGATVTGPRRTGPGDGNGNAGTLSALRTGSTQGTAWLNNNTVIAFDGFGELITLDVTGIAGGTENNTPAGFLPTVMTNWKIANTEVSFTAQNTDIEYNPTLDPNHIYASVTKNTSFDTSLYAYNYNPGTGAITLNTTLTFPNPTGNFREPREIAFDAAGNLYLSAYAGSSSDNLVLKLANATNLANWTEANVQVFFAPVVNTGFSGLDVAFSDSGGAGLAGDYNHDNSVDAADYTVWRDGLGGAFVQADYDVWKGNFGATGPGSGGLSGGAVPEPTSGLLLLFGVAGLWYGRRTNR